MPIKKAERGSDGQTYFSFLPRKDVERRTQIFVLAKLSVLI